MNLLFVCRSNCFRSKVAEAYFNKINKNKNLKAKSAGLITGGKQSDCQIKTAREFGLDIKGKQNGISHGLLRSTDFLIIVADDVPRKIFNHEKNKKYIKRVLAWNIKDVKSSKDIKDIKRAIKQIMNKVDKLVKNLEEAK